MYIYTFIDIIYIYICIYEYIYNIIYVFIYIYIYVLPTTYCLLAFVNAKHLLDCDEELEEFHNIMRELLAARKAFRNTAAAKAAEADAAAENSDVDAAVDAMMAS